jgi:hypothetical protein
MVTKTKEKHHLSSASYDIHLDLIWNEVKRPLQYETGIMHGETCQCCARIYQTKPKGKPKRKEKDLVRID